MATVEFQSLDIRHDTFDAAELQHLQDEDSAAFTSISAILLFIIAAGLLLGALSVIVILMQG